MRDKNLRRVARLLENSKNSSLHRKVCHTSRQQTPETSSGFCEPRRCNTASVAIRRVHPTSHGHKRSQSVGGSNLSGVLPIASFLPGKPPTPAGTNKKKRNNSGASGLPLSSFAVVTGTYSQAASDEGCTHSSILWSRSNRGMSSAPQYQWAQGRESEEKNAARDNICLPPTHRNQRTSNQSEDSDALSWHSQQRPHSQQSIRQSKSSCHRRSHSDQPLVADNTGLGMLKFEIQYARQKFVCNSLFYLCLDRYLVYESS